MKAWMSWRHGRYGSLAGGLFHLLSLEGVSISYRAMGRLRKVVGGEGGEGEAIDGLLAGPPVYAVGREHLLDAVSYRPFGHVREGVCVLPAREGGNPGEVEWMMPSVEMGWWKMGWFLKMEMEMEMEMEMVAAGGERAGADTRNLVL
ncbi:hypothetical protein L249_2711 [Ophiocordyceps polyrhachis-furcata BCC 54312]|uniref:Uncharacterized protein n=1 Tax=Ophiocordyceps polyrhachis-furcata BCC 54312 TaxID=1330021 RepID=A0A367LN67_9HYPO|nr:hypothetical protein L249_2711 [Ophiocordyceps polyrhachis-furcata BCC 54312]